MRARRLFFGSGLLRLLQQQLAHWRAEQFPTGVGHPIAAASLHIMLPAW